MNKVRIGLKALVAISIIAAIFFVAPTVGRFVPTHKIVEPVYCGSCHPEQVAELASTTHIASFAAAAQKMANLPLPNSTTMKSVTEDPDGNWTGKTGYGYSMSDAEAISAGCTMCHNYWENFKWFGVPAPENPLEVKQADCPPDAGLDGCTTGENIGLDAPMDIYGNRISPYGLGSTKAQLLTIYSLPNESALVGVEPWTAGIDVYKYTKTYNNGTATKDITHYRLDYIWSVLSAQSPGPVAFQVKNNDTMKAAKARSTSTARSVTCGTAEKGMCHIAENAVAMSAADRKLEWPNQASLSASLYNLNNSGPSGTKAAGVFYTHEMAYTTAQYAAKPVKLCGACHVFKLPPMKWGGEPWAGFDIRANSSQTSYGSKGWTGTINETKWPATSTEGAGGPEHKVNLLEPTDAVLKDQYDDPFNLEPMYDQSGRVEWVRDPGASTQTNFSVDYKTPDWAHQIVPCIRCHSHAGINGESVSDNK